MEMNVVAITGNLTRDPESREVGDSTVCNFGIALNEVWYDSAGEKQERANFFDVECWGKTAESVMEYMSKGRKVGVQGALRYSTWEDRDTGEKRSKVSIKAFNVIFLGGKENGDNGSSSNSGADTDNNADDDWFNF